jgi:hypothetical protein
MKNIITIFSILCVILFFQSCTVVVSPMQQVAGNYRAIDDNRFGNEIILYPDGLAQELHPTCAHDMSFTISNNVLFFNNGNQADVNINGSEFCFKTIQTVDNPMYWNDNDGYDDYTGYAIPEFITRTFLHRYRRY